MNTFVLFLSRVIGYFFDKFVLCNTSDSPGIGYYATTIVLVILLGFGAAIIVAKLSLHREFQADCGAANRLGPLPALPPWGALRIILLTLFA